MSESGEDAIGLYPLFEDGTCSFLVFDFDNHEKGAEKTDFAKLIPSIQFLLGVNSNNSNPLAIPHAFSHIPPLCIYNC